MLRYIELNPVRAKLVNSSHQWPWCSASVRVGGKESFNRILATLPEEIPVEGDKYQEWLQSGVNEDEVVLIRESLQRGRPYGNANWVELMVKEHNLVYTMRRDGRPCKE
jgi:putative transposase